MYDIVHDSRGHYTLFVDGKFEGNYDTKLEAMAVIPKASVS